MTEEEHGLFSVFFDARDLQWEAYCVCGDYEVGPTRSEAVDLLVANHLAVVAPEGGEQR